MNNIEIALSYYKKGLNSYYTELSKGKINDNMFFPEICIDNWKNITLIAQNYVYKYGFLRIAGFLFCQSFGSQQLESKTCKN